MSLESKAQTRRELVDFIYLPFSNTKEYLLKEKWVPLEEAQKEVNRGIHFENEYGKLLLKIAEAQRFLETEGYSTPELRRHLREALR